MSNFLAWALSFFNFCFIFRHFYSIIHIRLSMSNYDLIKII